MSKIESQTENNHFKFEFTVKGKILYQRIFDSDVYNHNTRYSVYIADIYKEMQKDIIHILTSKRNSLTLQTKYSKKRYDTYNVDSPILSIPNESMYDTDAFMFTFYINNHIIINRKFTLYQKDNSNFYTHSLFSMELYNILDYYCSVIQNHIKKKDEEQLWQEYYLMTYHNIQPKESRELPADKRKKLLYQCNYF